MDEPPALILKLTGVMDVQVHDTERVGWYDLNSLEWESDCAVIRCNIPLTIVARFGKGGMVEVVTCQS